MYFFRVLLTIAGLLIHLQLFSQLTLLKDINTNPAFIEPDNAYNSSFFCKCGGFMYFTAETNLGRELWQTDGTADGTHILKDINLGSGSGVAGYGTRCINNVLYFLGDNGSTGYEPWISDGTAGGTRLIKEIKPGSEGANSTLFIPFNGSIYFFATSANSDGTALWKIGQSLEPVEITLISASIQIFMIEEADNYIYFFLNDYSKDNTTAWQLWRTDGSASGTIKIYEGPDFLAYIKSIGDKLFFSYYDQSTNGSPLWVTSGQASDAVKIIDMPWIQNLFEFNGKLIIGTTYSTWISDGTKSGTEMLTYTKTDAGVIKDGSFYGVGYSSDREKSILFNTDGTTQGTHFNADLDDGSTRISIYENIAMVNDKFILPVYDSEHGSELGVSDGTPSGTKQIKDIFPGEQGSAVRDWTLFNDKVFFLANDGVHGSEIWYTDGSEAGTIQLKDIATGSDDGWTYNSSFFLLNNNVNYTAVSNTLQWDYKFYSVDEQQNASGYYSPENFHFQIGSFKGESYFLAFDNLFKTNGSTAGTSMVKKYYPQYASISFPTGSGVSVADKFIYDLATFDGSYAVGRELWVTDGTEGGSDLLKDINPGLEDGVTRFTGAVLGNKFFFEANNGVSGAELWTTDGTTAGTTMLVDLNEGVKSSFPFWFTQLGNYLLFSADDGVHGPELWQTDGTAGGTIMLKDLSSAPVGYAPRELVKLNDQVLFVAYDNTNGWALWKTNGTDAGTVMVKDIYLGNDASIKPEQLHVIGSKIYFSANDGKNGNELWITDGTTAGTYQIDINKGVGDSDPSLFIATDSYTYFIANNQLWKTDGTDLHTKMVSNLQPIDMIYKNGWLYVAADSPDYGQEVFKLQILKEDQTIVFSPIITKVMGDNPFNLVASSTSGLPITFVSTSDKVSIINNVTTILKAGSVTVNANQPGNVFFNAALQVPQVFCINPAKPVITSVNDASGFILLTSNNINGNQWYLNGARLESSGNATFLAKESGNYSLQVSVDNCESELSDAKDVVITGLDETSSKQIGIYPNPVSTDLHFYSAPDQTLSVEISNINGQIIEKFSVAGSANHSVASYTSGIYFVKITSSSDIVVKKFMKE